MKFSIFTVGAPEYTPKELLIKLKEYGYDGVEWRVTEPSKAEKGAKADYWENNLCTIDEATIEEKADELKAMCDSYGVEICALGTYMRCNEYEKAESALRAAVKLGCKKIRVSPYTYNGEENYNDLFNKAVKDYGVMEELAKKYGVKVNLEMHMNTITASASAAYRLVSHFDSRYIGVVYDVGNMVHEGFENYKAGLEILGDYLDHVHIKSSAWKEKETLEDGTVKWAVENMPLNKGSVDFRKFLKVLKDSGYDGYVSFEDFSDEKSTDEKLKFNIEYIRGIMSEIENEK